MKLRLATPDKPVTWLRRALSRNHRILTRASAALFALGLFSTASASADVIAGWETWLDAGGKVYNASLTNGATGQAVGTASAGSGWGNWTNAGFSNGASIDGTWGTVATATPPTTDTTEVTAGVGLLNATTSGEMTFTVTNTTGGDMALTGFYFDGGATRNKAALNWSLSILDGSAVTVTSNINSGTLPLKLGATTGNFDTDLTALEDRTLADGETVIFQLAFTGGFGDGAGGNNSMIDNVAVTADSLIANKLAITSVPASAVAGENFSVTVQTQDSGGSPLNVTQDTVIELVPSGSSTITGNTATILSGNSSVTLDLLQYTKAETITLSAGRTSGDLFSSSGPSAPINILAGPASQFAIETAADGSGVPVGARTVFPANSITVYAITRDSFGNFVANNAESWSLENIVGGVVSGDLVDNTDGSATFTANGLGTANIRATLTDFPNADSGLITVEEFVHRWTGAGANGSWETAGSWSNSILPAFDNMTDLLFSDPTNTKGNPYLGSGKTVRSITFDYTSTASFTINLVRSGNALPADLTFDTDSATEPAKINVETTFTGVATLGYYATTEAGRGIMILADNLLVTHNGSDNFIINGDITESGGSYGITKAGSGTLVLSGTNSYTGKTTVNGGVLAVTGGSIADTNTLVINGGIVDVTGNEVVAAMFFEGNPKAEGVYGSTASSAPLENQDDTRFTGTGTITISPVASGYSTWATANTGGQSPDEDFNLDGVDNGIAYFMNDSGLITHQGIVGGTITWMNGGNIPASAYGTQFEVETSPDLDIWTPVPAADLTTNNDTTLIYTPTTGLDKLFVRLKVNPN